jgi:hypothetical protein
MFANKVKAWAAGVFGAASAFAVQWLNTPGNVEGVTATITDWSTTLINTAVVAVVAWVGTYFAPKNAP